MQARNATRQAQIATVADARVMRSRAWRGMRAAVDENVAAKHQLTFDDAMLLLVCWIIFLWLILGGS